jgi:molybdopterin synthase sulfur carrier subunit
MAVVRLFASAREAAGRTSDHIDAPTVGAVLDEACRRYGDRFSAVLKASNVWVNGEPAVRGTPVISTDVVAVLPPVSGGSAVARPPVVAKPVARPAPAPPPARPGPRPPIVRGNLALVPEPEPDPEPAPDVGAEAGVEPAPDAAASPRTVPPRPPLAVVHQSVRPHGRLGLAWATVTVGATVAGPRWLSGWLALAALVAATQTAGVWRRRGERPLALLAGALAAAVPVAAAFDLKAINGVVVAGVAVGLVTRLVVRTKAPSRDVALTLVIGVPIGLAAASPVLVRHAGIMPALLLLGFAAVYDAGAYLVGTGAASAWEGPAAGIAAFVPLTIFAAVVFVPPFSGAEPLLLGLLAALLTPLGPVAASALLGDRTADAPGLRRLDSLLLLGPVWAWCALIFLR